MKKIVKCLYSVLLVAALVMLSGSILYAAEQKITVAGSSTIRPIIVKAAKEFKKLNPDVKFMIGGGGSSHGVKSAGSGKITIGMASRKIYEKEIANWPDMAATKIGIDGVAVIINSKNPMEKITRQQVQDIYVGKINNWKELGGMDAEIILVSKEEGRSTLDLFLKYFGLEAKEVGEGKVKTMVHRQKGTEIYSSKTAKLIGPNRQALATIATKSNAIAYVSVGTAQEVSSKGGNVKLLELDGVEATIENVANETYPFRRPLNLITKGEPEGFVKDFIEFMTGESGKVIVSALEFIPAQ